MGDFSKSDAYASLLRFSHLSRVFRPSSAHSCECSRARGWRGRRESDSQVTLISCTRAAISTVTSLLHHVRTTATILPRSLALLSWAGELSSQSGPCGRPGW